MFGQTTQGNAPSASAIKFNSADYAGDTSAR